MEAAKKQEGISPEKLAERESLLEQIANAKSRDQVMMTLMTLNDDQKVLLAGDEDWATYAERLMSGIQGANEMGGPAAVQTGGAALVGAAVSSVSALASLPITALRAGGRGGKAISDAAAKSLGRWRGKRIERAAAGVDGARQAVSEQLAILGEDQDFLNYVSGNSKKGVDGASLAAGMVAGGDHEDRLTAYKELVGNRPDLAKNIQALNEAVETFGRDGKELAELSVKHPELTVELNGTNGAVSEFNFTGTLDSSAKEMGDSLDMLPLPNDEMDPDKGFKSPKEKLDELLEAIQEMLAKLSSIFTRK